jgi:hypothetical protein
VISDQDRAQEGARAAERDRARAIDSAEYLGRSDLDGGIEGDRVLMTRPCGAVLVPIVAFG